ncbi:MAG: hypothetical protein LBH73_06915, partial [Spirochaetaceae bacterium]|nr:hypothetical protein [Spirochaetaceae bacterium]
MKASHKGLPAKTAILMLSLIFITSLVTMVALNYKRQTSVFWENQLDKLIILTERYTNRFEDFLTIQSTLLSAIAEEVSLGILETRAEYENYLNLAVKSNKDFLSGYMAFDNGDLYLSAPGFSHPGYEDPAFALWYEAGKLSKEVFFTEPYLDKGSGSVAVTCLTGVSRPDGTRGVIGLDIRLDRLEDLMEGVRPSKNGGVYISSLLGKIIISTHDPESMPRIEDGHVKFTTIKELNSEVEILRVLPGLSDHKIVVNSVRDSAGKTRYETTAVIAQTGWTMGFNMYIDDYQQEISDILRFQMPLILLAFLMSGIGIIIAIVLINYSRDRAALEKNIALANSASKTKGEFLSRMSHEMRTPLNAIIGMTRIADATTDVGKLRYCLSTIETSSSHLLGIINDVLDMSKIEAGKFILETVPINLEKILMKISNLIIDGAEQKNQQFNILMDRNMGIHYLGDELRLSQVITNLLSNAVKFT